MNSERSLQTHADKKKLNMNFGSRHHTLTKKKYFVFFKKRCLCTIISDIELLDSGFKELQNVCSKFIN